MKIIAFVSLRGYLELLKTGYSLRGFSLFFQSKLNSDYLFLFDFSSTLFIVMGSYSQCLKRTRDFQRNKL